MGRPIIEVSNLSKLYHLGAIGATSLREELSRYWDRARGRHRPDGKDFWALRDVSFSAQPGEVIGVIGSNGAGKSTLLKILSRITEPTSGRAIMRGRIASLLEVGTGFHPELTGRENIFLNGAILGMTRAEVRRKFDEIVAFAEVDSFIDTPVKHYSSGMYVRLAFAVAAHLEPEILVVDEVLAVGDAQFQKKCIGKMRDFASERGRTILFVSHNLGAVIALCQKAIYLSHGRMLKYGPVSDVVSEYAQQMDVLTGVRNLASDEVRRRGNGAARFTAARLADLKGSQISAAVQGRPFRVELDLAVRESIPLAILSITLIDPWNNDLFTTMHYDSLNVSRLEAGKYAFAVDFDPNFLARGNFGVRLACFGPNFLEYDYIHNAFTLLVSASAEDNDFIRPRPGTVRLPLAWSMRQER